MATFEVQVEGLTGLDIGTVGSPTQAELTQFLTDGTMEVINAMPFRLKMFCATEDTFTSTAVGSEAETLDSAKVLSVTRRDGSSVEQPCREIPASLRGKASDSDEMIAATVSDPVYYIYNGKLNALPASGACKYLEVNNPAVAFGDSSISNFPDEYEYLVALYGAVKTLGNKITSLAKADLNISTSAPSAPSLATISYSNASNADASSSAVSPITVSTVSKADISGDVPSYTKPSTTVNFGSGNNFDTMLGTNEDVELAAIELQKQTQLLNAHRTDIDNELNDFNKENVRYQANVQAELTKHNNDLQVALRQAQLDAADAQQEASQATDVDKFNKAQDQALDLQNKAQTLQAAIQNNDDLVQKFLAELNKYSAEVNTSVQEYSQNLNTNNQNYQFYKQQQDKLQADYDKGIQAMRAS
tara:strand:+ start:510 stop:1760 length:1251 start_codon:yes stop_codon:yes gene_type:complete